MRKTVIGAACLLALWPGAMSSARAASPAASPVDSTATTVVDWDAFNYGRAVDCWMRADYRAAADYLERIDVSPASSYAQADHAAFLLTMAYLRLDDARAFDRVAARAGSDTGSAYRRWIRYCALLRAHRSASESAATAPRDFAGGAVMEAALWLESGQAQAALDALDTEGPDDATASIQLYVRALARSSMGEDASSQWETLAGRKPRNAAEADLIARAALELAESRLSNTANAAKAIALVPKESRYYPRALQLRAMLHLEAGDTAQAGTTLRDLQRDYPRAEGSRDTQDALGAMMMQHGYWYAALRYFEAAGNDWEKESAAITRIENGEGLDDAWRTWRQRDRWIDEIRLAPEALLARAGSIADASLPEGSPPPAPAGNDDALSLWPNADAVPDTIHALTRFVPTADEWARVRDIERSADAARSDLAHETQRYDARRTELDRRGRYLDRGALAAQSSADTLQQSIARLTALIARLDATLAELTHVRDAALMHVAARTREMVTQLRDELVFMQALRHFYVDGPYRDRPEVFPPGVPPTADVLAREQTLALEAEQFLEFFASHYAGVIRLSFDRAWRPHLAENSRRLHAELGLELARAGAVDRSIDSSRTALAHDSELAAIGARRTLLVGRIDSLDVALVATQRSVAAAVAGRARAVLAGEREAIDYHLADASYEIAVEACTDSVTAENPDATGPPRDHAIQRLHAFIADYPRSPARAETRYRLADLELLAAREAFRSSMAGFLGGAPDSRSIQNRSLAPFVNYAPAIEQYEAILREDPSFAHTDAVLFNLGMILADDGRADAIGYLRRLVTEFPSSPDVQEAWLRMGNERFDARDFAGSIPLLAHAIPGKDASFTAMALYRLGWSQFEQEHFDDAVASFAGLIDHYNQHGEIARKIDLRHEAEECLVHTLARAGGADAFTRYFDRTGHRDYEARVLAGLATLFRGSSLFADAAACETLWLSRYPDDPTAFAAAERLVDTYRQWNKPDLAREAKRMQADRFLPGTAWYKAQKDERVRDEATAFARSAYRESAAFEHARAKKSNQPGDWKNALAQYDAYLKLWPDADDSPRLHFLASDAAAHLEAYPAAMRHLGASMTSDSLSLVHDAAWQRVVVADAWYRRSQRDAHAKTGSDSLATVVIKTGDEFTSRFSSDPRCADVAWRQGNMALAHGRFDDAATRLERFGTQYPSDARALPAVVRSGDARYRLKQYESAGATYEKALAMARTAKKDSLATALEATVPTCYYQAAEQVAKSDSTKGERNAAPMFARVARAWPKFSHADLALYRAGLGFSTDQHYNEAVAAWEELLRAHPESEYARDSAAQIALVTEKSGNKAGAALAYERFASAYPKDADAPEALLKAADLRVAAGDEAGAEQTRSRFIAAYPEQTAAVMQIRAARAQKELAACASTGAPVSALLGKKSSSDLKAYLALAATHPDLAAPALLAQCDFQKGEEAHASYASVKLTQPLPKSIEKKKARLEASIALYEQCSKRGVSEFTRASAYRIGQSLIEFGDALAASERPKGLTSEDLAAYNDVITEQSYAFFDRGEDAWSTLLRQSAGATDDPGRWLARTRETLWPRLGARFMFHPEIDYPVVRADGPAGP